MISVNKNMKEIIESMQVLGFDNTAQQIQDASETCDNDLAIVALALKTIAIEKKNERTRMLLKRSKIENPRYFSRLLTIPERQLDVDYINELQTLAFIKEHHNLVIWGSPGTGKSWMMDALGTRACEEGLRTRYISFPSLYRDLEKKYHRNSASLEARIKYYCNFRVLCIDEFPNSEVKELFLVQELFSELEKKGTIIIIGSQSDPENWPKLFKVLSLGQSISGRIAGKAKKLHLVGPDLRKRKDLDLD